MSHTDQELFCLIADQKEKAFNVIYRKYHPKLFICVKRMLKNSMYAEDIVHDVFIQLWQGGASLSTITNPVGWLLRLAANRTLNHLRREARGRQMKKLLSLRPGFVPGEAESDFRELQAIVERAVEKLPADTGAILRSSIELGLSREQIAREMDLPVGTVKNKLEYGRRVLREYVRTHVGSYLLWVLIGIAFIADLF